MAAEAKRTIPELKTILVHTNDSGTGLCWAEGQYSGPNGPERCRTRGTGRRVRDLAEALHNGAVQGGGDIDVRIGGQFTTHELDDIALQLPPHTYLSGRDPLVVGGHGASERDPTAMGVATMVLQSYPVLGLINPLTVLGDLEKFQEPQVRTLVIGTALPWYYRADEPLDTTARLIDLVEDAIASTTNGLMPRFRKLRKLSAKWGGEENADRLFEGFYLIDQAVTACAQAGRYTTLYAGVSTRHINRPLVFRPETLSHDEESYFLPFVFNESESQARQDYIDNHGNRLRGPLPGDPAYQQFASAALRAAAIFEEIRNAPQQAWLNQLAVSLRMWVSVPFVSPA